MTQLKQHPLSSAFPAMAADDFAALVEDIRANGQREPVMVYEGMVLDGWHRYQACTQIGIEPQKFNFPADKDPIAFVLSHNLHRRHLTPSQRAAAVVACTEWAPANRPKKVEPGSTFSKNEELAKAAGVTPRTITDAKAAHKAGLTEAVKEGALTVKEAAKVARGKTEAAPKKEELKSSEKRALNERPAEIPELTDSDELAEAHHTITELAQENEQLRDKLAVESLMESEEAKTQTAETIRELRERVRVLEIELDAVKASRDGYMRESAEKEKQISYWRKQAERKAAA